MNSWELEEWVCTLLGVSFTIFFLSAVPPVIVGSIALTKYWWHFV